MELTPDEPGMGRKLDNLHERAIRRQAAEIQPVLDEAVTVLVVDLVAVTMPLTHLRLAINSGGLRAGAQSARVGAESHRPAHVGHVLLAFHERDHRNRKKSRAR